MIAKYKLEQDGSISITLTIKPEVCFPKKEEQIAAAVAEVGRLATASSLKAFDTSGQPIIVDNVKKSVCKLRRRISDVPAKSPIIATRESRVPVIACTC